MGASTTLQLIRQTESRAASELEGRASRELLAMRCEASDTLDSVELTRRLARQIRRIFLLIDEFLVLGKDRFGRRRLEPLVHELIADARECFNTAADLRRDEGGSNAEHARCLADLLAFRASLSSPEAPSSTDVMHAMDSLIVHCVLLDDEPRGLQGWTSPAGDCAA